MCRSAGISRFQQNQDPCGPSIALEYLARTGKVTPRALWPGPSPRPRGAHAKPRPGTKSPRPAPAPPPAGACLCHADSNGLAKPLSQRAGKGGAFSRSARPSNFFVPDLEDFSFRPAAKMPIQQPAGVRHLTQDSRLKQGVGQRRNIPERNQKMIASSSERTVARRPRQSGASSPFSLQKEAHGKLSFPPLVYVVLWLPYRVSEFLE